MFFSFRKLVPLFFFLNVVYTHYINNRANICKRIYQFRVYSRCFLTLITKCFIEKSSSQS